jgi:hypothetical protein
VFTPLPRLGLIVVDEEHDASYKQHEGVRYNARDLAIWRARQRSVPIVLGSATPSLESWHAADTGRYRRVELASRAVAATLPKVRPVDIRREKLQNGVSEHLLRAIAARLERGEQSLVFLNRRGYAPVLSCPSCGWVSRCPHCTANMVLHLADKRLRCHHCSYEAGIPLACPDCGDQDIQPFGRGTQRLEETLGQRFPDARVLRVDRDAARTRSQWDALLEQIGRGDADILVGTQMMAKGHDFPRLTFVGVLNADSSLFAADFRAPERLFQQLMQVGGRAGRGELPGEVMIQTQYPDHPLYKCLARPRLRPLRRVAAGGTQAGPLSALMRPMPCCLPPRRRWPSPSTGSRRPAPSPHPWPRPLACRCSTRYRCAWSAWPAASAPSFSSKPLPARPCRPSSPPGAGCCGASPPAGTALAPGRGPGGGVRGEMSPLRSASAPSQQATQPQPEQGEGGRLRDLAGEEAADLARLGTGCCGC